MQEKINQKNKQIVSRNDDFNQWYTSVILKSQLIAYSEVKGTMFFLPRGWKIWQLIQKEIDQRFEKMHVQNVQLPLFIKENSFLKEQEHVKNFAPEIFLVTHNNKTPLTDKLVVRPTSEILFCDCFKNMITSYADLPLLFNQWCSVYRVEKNTRPFLRNCEFYWQELHTVHSDEKTAIVQAQKTLDVYLDFFKKVLCIPVLSGEKTAHERFGGALATYTLEALMQDGQALQCATSHYLSQNFSKAYDVKFQTKTNKWEYVYQTSAGLSTRIIGGLIMSHSDDNGLVLPTQVAPVQITIISFPTKDKKTTAYIKKIKTLLSKKYRVEIDNSDKSIGFKINKHQINGVPFLIIVGQKEIQSNSITIINRCTQQREIVPWNKCLIKYWEKIMNTFDTCLYDKAQLRLNLSIQNVKNIDEFTNAIKNKKIALAYFNDTEENEEKLKQLTGATARCIKQILPGDPGHKCFFTGQNATHLIYFARAY